MGTYCTGYFSHCGDAARIVEIGRSLLAEGYTMDEPDGFGLPQMTEQSLKLRWESKSLSRSVQLASRDLELIVNLYGRIGTIYHLGVRWWAFATDGKMDSGLGRAEVRKAFSAMARRFGSDRILYVSDRNVTHYMNYGEPLDHEEQLLMQIAPPLSWDHGIEDPDKYMSSWFREDLGR